MSKARHFFRSSASSRRRSPMRVPTSRAWKKRAIRQRNSYRRRTVRAVSMSAALSVAGSSQCSGLPPSSGAGSPRGQRRRSCARAPRPSGPSGEAGPRACSAASASRCGPSCGAGRHRREPRSCASRPGPSREHGPEGPPRHPRQAPPCASNPGAPAPAAPPPFGRGLLRAREQGMKRSNTSTGGSGSPARARAGPGSHPRGRRPSPPGCPGGRPPQAPAPGPGRRSGGCCPSPGPAGRPRRPGRLPAAVRPRSPPCARMPEVPLPPPPGASRPEVATSPSWFSVVLSWRWQAPAARRGTAPPSARHATPARAPSSPPRSTAVGTPPPVPPGPGRAPAGARRGAGSRPCPSPQSAA